MLKKPQENLFVKVYIFLLQNIVKIRIQKMLQHSDFRPAVVEVKLLDSHFAAHYQYKCKTFLRPSEAKPCGIGANSPNSPCVYTNSMASSC